MTYIEITAIRVALGIWPVV